MHQISPQKAVYFLNQINHHNFNPLPIFTHLKEHFPQADTILV